MSDLAVNSSLLVATLDLNLVKLITQAIRTVDQNAPASGGSTTVSNHSRSATIQSVVQTPIRNCERPAGSFEPSHVPHWHPRLSNLQPYGCTNPVQPAQCRSSIQPPWRVLPWPMATRPAHAVYIRSVKILPGHTDVSDVGRTLDLFV